MESYAGGSGWDGDEMEDARWGHLSRNSPPRRPRRPREAHGGAERAARRAPANAQAQAPRLTAFAVSRSPLTAAQHPLLRTKFGLERLPLAPARAAVEIVGCSTALANGLRRVLLDELPGRALKVPNIAADETTERFMLDQFLRLTAGALPLRRLSPGEVDGLTFDLVADNLTGVERVVYAGELTPSRPLRAPMFNPTATVALLQPGKRLVVRGITIAEAPGRVHGGHASSCRAAISPRDLAEHPREATHSPGGVARDESGFLESCLDSDPRHYVVAFTLAAAGEDPDEPRAVFAAACAHLAARARAAGAAAESRAPGVWISAARADGWDEGTLSLDNETMSVGELLRRYVFDLAAPGPDGARASAAAQHIAHEDRLVLTVCAPAGAAELVRAAAERAADDLDRLAAESADAPAAEFALLVPPPQIGPWAPGARLGVPGGAEPGVCETREWRCGGRLRVGAPDAPAAPDRGLGGVLAAAPGRWLSRTEAAPGGGARLVTWAADSAAPALGESGEWVRADFAAGAAFSGRVGVFDAPGRAGRAPGDAQGVDTPAAVIAAVFLRCSGKGSPEGQGVVDAVRVDT